MKIGEYYTPKDAPMNYNNYSKDPTSQVSKMMGYIIIELVEYLGNDLWKFKNRGSGSVSFGSSGPKGWLNLTISGERLYKEYIKIGEASDNKLTKELKQQLKDIDMEWAWEESS